MNNPASTTFTPSDSAIQQLTQILKHLSATQQKLQLSSSLSKEIDYLNNKIQNFRVTVPLVGKFSSGKSSLLNAYLGKDYLRYDITPETAFATELTYAEQELAIIYRVDGSYQTCTLDEFKQLPEPENVLYAQLQLNNEQLRIHSNLTLVDMPGFDAQNQAHHQAIARYIEKGDLFINLLPSNIPFDGTVMQQLAEIHYGYDKKIVCLLSKAGRCTQPELLDKKREVAELLALHLEQNAEVGSVESMPPSQDLKAFVDALKLAESKHHQLLMQRFGKSVQDTLKSANAEVSALLNFATTDHAELEQKLRATSREFEQAQCNLNKHLDRLRQNLLNHGIIQLRQQCQSALSNASEQLVLAAKNNTLSIAINNILRPTVQSGLQQLVHQEVAQLQTKLEALSTGNYTDIEISLQLPEAQKDGIIDGIVDIAITLLAFLLRRKWKFLDPIVSIISTLLGSEMQEQQRDEQIRDQINQQVIPQAAANVEQQVGQQLREIVEQLSDACQQAFAEKRADFETRTTQMQQELTESQHKHQRLTDSYIAHSQQITKSLELCEILMSQVAAKPQLTEQLAEEAL